MNVDSLKKLKKRLEKINIDIVFSSNYPWIYIDSINGLTVMERHLANHGFTIAFLSNKVEDTINYPNLREAFKLIRTYKIKSE